MSERAARQLRRDVRRAVGDDGLAAIGAQTHMLQERVMPMLSALSRRVAAAEHQSDQRFIDDSQAHQRLENRLTEVKNDYLLFKARGFWKRLGWLLFSR